MWLIGERRPTGWVMVYDPRPWPEVITFLNDWEREARETWLTIQPWHEAV